MSTTIHSPPAQMFGSARERGIVSGDANVPGLNVTARDGTPVHRRMDSARRISQTAKLTCGSAELREGATRLRRGLGRSRCVRGQIGGERDFEIRQRFKADCRRRGIRRVARGSTGSALAQGSHEQASVEGHRDGPEQEPQRQDDQREHAPTVHGGTKYPQRRRRRQGVTS